MKRIVFGAAALLAAAFAHAPASAQAQGPSSATPAKPHGVIGEPGGGGPMPAVAVSLKALPNHTLYHPARWPDGPLPLVLWGNGGCRDNGLQHSAFLRAVASHGYVVAAMGVPRAERLPETAAPPPQQAPAARNSGPPTAPDETSPSLHLEAMDWASRETTSAKGAFRGRIDMSRIAVMGHSCGGLQAIITAADPRIDTAVIMNSGIYNQPFNIPGRLNVGKDQLWKLHGPVAYLAGGPSDIAHANARDDVERINHVPVFFGEKPVGHGGTFWSEPNGGDWARLAVKWLDWRLKGDQAAAATFEGDDCELCSNPDWTLVRKGLRPGPSSAKPAAGTN